MTWVRIPLRRSIIPIMPRKLERLSKLVKPSAGYLLCGSGVGACIAANKMQGVYSAICHDTYSAHQGVEHDDMNVLCLGAAHHRPGTGPRTCFGIFSGAFRWGMIPARSVTSGGLER
jgi:ribose 5-phosphate isomerase RpiB